MLNNQKKELQERIKKHKHLIMLRSKKSEKSEK
jgi:hypothetical protein